MSKNFLTDAFKELDILNEETFSFDKDGISKLKSFFDEEEFNKEEPVIDPDAETEEDLQDDYIGKALCACAVCHSYIFKDPSDIKIDEETQFVNVDEECPYCHTMGGYKVVGQIDEFKSEDDEDKSEEVSVDEEEFTESKKALTEDFDPSTPDWLIRELSKDFRGISPFRDSLLRKNIDLNKVKFIPASIPQNARELNSYIKDNKLPILKIGDKYYDVYSPSIPGIVATNLSNRDFYYKYYNSIPYKHIVGDVTDFVYIDLNDPSNKTTELRKERADAKKGSIERGRGQYKYFDRDYIDGKFQDLDTYRWVVLSKEDKSGYKLPDPDKYKKMLDKLDLSNYSNILKRYYDKLQVLKDKIASIYANLGPNSKDLDAFSGAVGSYLRALERYNDFTKTIDKIVSKSDLSDDEKSKRLEYSFAEYDLRDIRDHLDNAKDHLNRFSRSNEPVKITEIEKDGVVAESVSKRDDIDADADDKKEKAKKAFMKAKDDADADRDYRLKSKGLKESDDNVELKYSAITKEKRDSLGKTMPLKDVLDLYWNSVNIDGNSYYKIAEGTYEDNSGAVSEDILSKSVIVSDGFDYDADQYPVISAEFVETREESLKEDFQRVEIETDKEKMSMTSDENGKTTVVTEPKAEECENCEEDKEVIAPVSIEVKDEIEANSEEDIEENTEDITDSEEVDVEEFDEEGFDELGESYLKEVYDNVKSYKTTSGQVIDNKLMLEGVIEFNSGKKAKTNFIFESKYKTKKGKLKFLGENVQFSNRKKAFILTASLQDKKIITEAFTYNYVAEDAETGKTTKLYGTVKRK